jgi:hypothetical protein
MFFTPKALNTEAQGCSRQRTTLGPDVIPTFTLKALHHSGWPCGV